MKKSSRQRIAVLYACELFDGLIDKNLISGDKTLTASGARLLKRVKVRGLRPTKEELRMASLALAERFRRA